MADRRIELRKELGGLDDKALLKRYGKVTGRTVANAKHHLGVWEGRPWRDSAIDVIVHSEAPRA